MKALKAVLISLDFFEYSLSCMIWPACCRYISKMLARLFRIMNPRFKDKAAVLISHSSSDFSHTGYPEAGSARDRTGIRAQSGGDRGRGGHWLGGRTHLTRERLERYLNFASV